MKLFIKNESNQNSTLILPDVELSDKIWYIKALIREKLAIPIHSQKLTFNNVELKNVYRLIDYKLKDGSRISLNVIDHDIKISVETTLMFQIDLNVNLSDKYLELYDKIAQELGFNQTSIFHLLSDDGQRLNFDKSVRDWKTNDQSHFYLYFEEPLDIYSLEFSFKSKPTENCSDDLLILKVDPVENLKEKLISRLSDVSIMRSSLFYDGVLMEDDHLINRYFTKDRAIVEIRETKSTGMKLFIQEKNKFGCIYLIVDPNETIENVKIRIQEVTGTKILNQKLIYEKETLKNDHTLEDYEIESNSIIHLIAKMMIVIKHGDNKEIKLNVSDSCTIGKIKKKIQVLENLPDKMALKFRSTRLNNNKTLAYYGLKNESTLTLHLNDDHLRIYVKTLTGHILRLDDLRSTNTIRFLKEKIKDENGIQTDDQILVNFNLEPLLEKRSLADYGIVNNALIYLRRQLAKKLFIDIFGEKTIAIESNDCNEYVKNKIEELEGIPADQQEIVNSEGHRAFSCFTQDGSKLYLSLKRKIIVQNSKKQKIEFSMDSNDRIGELKRKINAVGFGDGDEFELIYQDKILDDYSSLRNEKIPDSSILCMVSKSVYRERDLPIVKPVKEKTVYRKSKRIEERKRKFVE